MIRLTVNGRTVDVDPGATLLDAARRAGVHVSTLCFHPRLPARGLCRLCLVEVRGTAHPQPACLTLARDGDVIDTDSTALREFRRADAQWLLSRHPNGCLLCEVSGTCQLQTLVNENQWGERWPKVPPGSKAPPLHRCTDHTSPAIWADLEKCVECGLCAEACGEAGQRQYVIGFAGRGQSRQPVTVFDRPLADSACISCGQCTLVCPVGALIEQPQWHEVLQVLDAHRGVSVVQVAPATRIAISEEFGLAPGTVSTGRLINALRQLGFDYVFDTNFGADLTVMEESAELLARLGAGDRLPLFTSCCPGWVNWVEIHRPDLLPHLSTTRSPQQMHGALTKRGRFARSLGTAFADGKAEPCVVSVMPCTAKKDEARRPGLCGDVDHVLTTRELARMIRARGIAFGALADDGRFDSPLGQSTGAGQIFGASGGVMEAMVRTVSHRIGAPGSAPLEWHQLRGVNESLKTAQIDGVGQVAICNGIAAAQDLLATEAWRGYVAIEVMACVGGCLGGGGEPKSMDPQVLRKRMQAVYEIDRHSPHRRCDENPDVQTLYATELQGEARTQALLHTSYAARGSPRELLMRFLDCVDRRDGRGAASLFHPAGVWSTGSGYGELRGAAAIEAFINSRLLPRAGGPHQVRHRMACAADVNDLTVITPTGERCRFGLGTATIEADGRTRSVIERLVRQTL